MILSRSAADGLARPVIDPAELDDVGITLLDQLFRCLLATVAAAAVYQNQLLLVRQFRNVLGADGFVRDIDGAGDMLLSIFLSSPNIQDDNEFEVSSLEPSLSDQERVQNFVRTQCTFDATAKTTVAELYTAFISFDEEAENSIPSSKFGRILSSCGFPIRSCRTTTMRGYEGIRLLG